jgi:23S rRNA (guanosine2251-2'-O)-methyltransferase
MEQQILVGFHAVIARIRQAPDTLKTVYYDVARRDRRMKEFIEITQETIGRKVHQADSERLRQLAGHDRHQGVVAFAEPASLARNVAELLDSLGDKRPYY